MLKQRYKDITKFIHTCANNSRVSELSGHMTFSLLVTYVSCKFTTFSERDLRWLGQSFIAVTFCW